MKPLSGNPASHGAEFTFVDGARFLDAAGTGKEQLTLRRSSREQRAGDRGGTRGRHHPFTTA